jgi:hypothetical protein
MLDGRNGDAHGVYLPGERFDVRENFGGKFGGDFRGAFRDRVHNPDKFRFG